jgi:hypothetical protein
MNPLENKLGPGLTDSDVIGAVTQSGYPLQTIVGERLRSDFLYVQDEWGFIDRDTGKSRALDLAAHRWLWGPEQPRVRPELTLLVECKQSELPFVFFLRSSGPILRSPLVVGERGTKITLTTDDERSTWNLDVLAALGLDTHDFSVMAPHAITFSRAVRKGKELNPSGSDAYSSLLLPLLKAMIFFEKTRSGPPTSYSDLHLVIAAGVLDAPMVGVSVAKGQTEYELVPWVRAVRHESYETTSPFEQQRLFAVDLVHRAFLDTYVSDHLLPFADEFGKRVLARQAVILSAKGHAKGLGSGSHGDALYQTLTERPQGDAVRRFWRPRRQ